MTDEPSALRAESWGAWTNGAIIEQDAETHRLLEWPCRECDSAWGNELRRCFASFGPEGHRVGCRKQGVVWTVKPNRMMDSGDVVAAAPRTRLRTRRASAAAAESRTAPQPSIPGL